MEYPLNGMHHSLRLCQNIISTIQYYYAWLMDGWTNRLTIFCHFPHSHLIVTVSLWLTMMELFKKREGHCHEYQLVMVGFISYGLMTMRNVHVIFDLISKVGTLSCKRFSLLLFLHYCQVYLPLHHNPILRNHAILLFAETSHSLQSTPIQNY